MQYVLLQTKCSLGLVDQVCYILVVGSAYQECMLGIGYVITIGCQRLVSDQNQMTLGKCTNSM